MYARVCVFALTYPHWGTADAEIKFISAENPDSSTHKRNATHSLQRVRYFRVSKQRYGCQCMGSQLFQDRNCNAESQYKTNIGILQLG